MLLTAALVLISISTFPPMINRIHNPEPPEPVDYFPNESSFANKTQHIWLYGFTALFTWPILLAILLVTSSYSVSGFSYIILLLSILVNLAVLYVYSAALHRLLAPLASKLSKRLAQSVQTLAGSKIPRATFIFAQTAIAAAALIAALLALFMINNVRIGIMHYQIAYFGTLLLAQLASLWFFIKMKLPVSPSLKGGALGLFIGAVLSLLLLVILPGENGRLAGLAIPIWIVLERIMLLASGFLPLLALEGNRIWLATPLITFTAWGMIIGNAIEIIRAIKTRRAGKK